MCYAFVSVMSYEIKHCIQQALFTSYLGLDQPVNTDSPSGSTDSRETKSSSHLQREST